jgi:hypothetical protein
MTRRNLSHLHGVVDVEAPPMTLRQRQEKLLDDAFEETFPASDPIAPKIIV